MSSSFRLARIVAFFSWTLAAGAWCSAKEPAPRSEEAISPRDGVIQLLDDQTLERCYTWLKDTQHADPRQVFQMSDGMLHISGDGLGAIVTRDRYRDYHLVLEYKWGGPTWHERENAARDSGLLVHSNGIDGGYSDTWMPAIEVQIIEGGVGDFIVVPGNDADGQPIPLTITCKVSQDRDDEFVWNAKGDRKKFSLGNLSRINWYGRDPDWKDEKGFRGKHDPDSPLGEWTRLDVICDGGHIQVFVNGTKVNEAFDAFPTSGRLQLQTELAEIMFRRWELWPLGQGARPAPAPAPAKQE